MTCGTKPASASTVSLRFSSTLTIDVRRRERAQRVEVDVLGAADLGDRLTVARGWMQKPVRPTSCGASPSSQTSSVMHGTSETMRASRRRVDARRRARRSCATVRAAGCAACAGRATRARRTASAAARAAAAERAPSATGSPTSAPPRRDRARDAPRGLVGVEQERHAVAVHPRHRRVDVAGADGDHGDAAAARARRAGSRAR